MFNLVVWMNMPSHHQSDFLLELSKLTKLKVFYTGNLDSRRLNDGWVQPNLKCFETFSLNIFTTLKLFILNRQSIHVIPGCGSFINYFIFILALIFNVKWVHLGESFPIEGRSFFKRVAFRFYYNSVESRSLGAFGIGDLATKSLFDAGVSKSKIRQTNYSSNIVSFRTRRKENNEKLKVIVLGRLCYNKGTNLILDCFEHEKSNCLEIDFYGSVSDDGSNYLNRIFSSKIINYKGILSSECINNVLFDYHVLLFPTLNDGWGMVATEAVNSGLPVITTKYAGCSGLIVKNNHNGLIVETSINAIRAALNKYTLNGGLVYEHSKNAMLLADEFSPIKTANTFLSDINELKCNS